MFEIDPDIFLEAASRVQRLRMYPYFDIAHYTLMCMAVRDDLATGATLFSRKHPLSCWLSCMLMCFAGSFVANFLMGEPVIIPFKRHDDILLASLVWFLPIKTVLSVLKEVQRTYKVHHGVLHAAKLHPNAYIVMVIIGTVKGAGSGIIRTFEQLVRGVWQPTGNEILRPSFYTKSCLIASIIFVVEKKTNLIQAPHELVYLGVLSSLLLGIHDPFLPFENLFCAVFMGGIWDALRAIAASKERRKAAAEGQADGPVPPEAKKEQ